MPGDKDNIVTKMLNEYGCPFESELLREPYSLTLTILKKFCRFHGNEIYTAQYICQVLKNAEGSILDGIRIRAYIAFCLLAWGK